MQQVILATLTFILRNEEMIERDESFLYRLMGSENFHITVILLASHVVSADLPETSHFIASF